MRQKIKSKHNLVNSLRKYDSKLESELHDTILQTWDYHPTKLPYIIEKTYEPDFVKVIDGVQFLCEVKGVLWDSTEAKKYNEIVKHLSPNQIFFFIFKDYNKSLLWSKRRKDGTKMTHKEWCEKNSFIYFDVKDYNSDELKKIATAVNNGAVFYKGERYDNSKGN